MPYYLSKLTERFKTHVANIREVKKYTLIDSWKKYNCSSNNEYAQCSNVVQFETFNSIEFYLIASCFAAAPLFALNIPFCVIELTSFEKYTINVRLTILHANKNCISVQHQLNHYVIANLLSLTDIASLRLVHDLMIHHFWFLLHFHLGIYNLVMKSGTKCTMWNFYCI